ncbi:DUF3168 domain-containing protein [Rhizobium oryzicola]|uniref:DUF3168 domain-containing protein n=1 Tax=Rhizobium oryzicola TaxID=1232668 RepID=A0ABT8SUY9_9HYPH|nr:DUF3168 domain-containing protein [Rhizobium oryzicola]MDO1581557.1 DUF3168 domain-containing protein [Rhizobium oryzicola]
MTRENALLSAIHARLSGDAAIVAEVGSQGICDRLLPRMQLPAVILSEVETRDYSTATEEGFEHILTLEVWASGEGRARAQEIAALVRLSLQDADLTLADGGTLVSLSHQTSRSRREPKTKLSIVEMRFRAVTE